MRIVDLHTNTRAAGVGVSTIEPRTNTVGIIAQVVADNPAATATATFSVKGYVKGFENAPETITLSGGTPIMSLSGTGKATVSGQVDGQTYSNIYVDMLSIGSSLMSFRSSAVEADE